jgi:hypothetical protein
MDPVDHRSSERIVSMTARLLAGTLALLAVAAPVAAQGRPIRVEGVKPLAFGVLLPGVPMTVLRTDPVRAGQLNVAGQPNSQIILQLSLPSVMTGPAGRTIPVVFGANDAGFARDEAIGSQQAFDPRVSIVVLTNTKNGRGSVFVGGTAQPAVNQQPGSYSAVITLTIAYP